MTTVHGKRFTNYSVRKTYIAKGRCAITAITGHNSEQSIAEYADSDLEDHQKISLLMHDSCSYLPVLHTEFSHIQHRVGGGGGGLAAEVGY